MSYLELVLRNLGARKVRSALTALAVSVGVVTVVTLGLVNHSIRSSAFALMQTGRADFTIAQKGVSDVLDSNVDAYDVSTIGRLPGVASTVGVLVSTTKLDADNPMFLEIGVPADALSRFGVTVLSGRAYAPTARDELMLGWRAARNLGKTVGDRMTVDGRPYRVVGLYATGQPLGETGAMFPLGPLQIEQRQVGEVTLVFVRARPGADLPALRAAIERADPQLTTVRTVADFGRADRSMQLIDAADKGSRLLAVLIGALVVMSMMTMAFIERIREFGVLSAVGWPRWRVLALVLTEASTLGVLGAAAGVGFSVGMAHLLPEVTDIGGILSIDFTREAVWRALYTAAGMTVLGALYPAVRAALLPPLEALRHE